MANLGDLIKSARAISSRYKMARRYCGAFKIEDVLTILNYENLVPSVICENDIYELLRAYRTQEAECAKLRDLRLDLHEQLMTAKHAELVAFKANYDRKQAEAKQRRDELQEHHRKLRDQLRAGELDDVKYQKICKPISRKKREIRQEFDQFVEYSLTALFPADKILIEEIEVYLWAHEDCKV